MTDQMTSNALDTDKRIVVIPEITIPASTKANAIEILERVEALRPQLDVLHEMAVAMRDQYHAALIALAPHMKLDSDEVLELASNAVGWTHVWEKISEVIGDRFSPEGGLEHLAMAGPQLRRGGVPDFPIGTVAAIVDPDGNPCRVEIEWLPQPSGDLYTVVDLATEKRYSCGHEELKAGIETIPDEAGSMAAQERRFAARMAARTGK